MKNKKAAMWIVLFVLMLPLGSGCAPTVTPNPDSYNLDYYAFSANYKQDQNCEWGKKAAVYNNQVYYSNPAEGGIFQMSLDGSRCQLAIEGPDVRKIQLSAQGVHYLGFVGNAYNTHHEEYRSFRLFFFDWITKKTLNLMETAWYTQVPEHDLDLWDFYRTEKGTIANMSGADSWGGSPWAEWPVFSLYYTSAEGPIREDQFTFLEKLKFAFYDQLYFSAESSFGSIDPIWGYYSLAIGAFSVADQQRNQLVMDTALVTITPMGSLHRTIDSFLPDGILAHNKNEMILLTGDFQDSARSVLLDGEDAIRFVVVSGDKAYIIADQGRPDRRQSVYKIDLETFAYEKLYTCAKAEKFLLFDTQEEEQILWLDTEKLVTAQGKNVRIWALTDGKYQLNRTLETSQNVVAAINKTDVASDWLFVYQFNEKNNRDELIEKLNIAISK